MRGGSARVGPCSESRLSPQAGTEELKPRTLNSWLSRSKAGTGPQWPS